MAILLHLDPSKGPGPNDILSLLIKNLAPQISISITYILNKSLNDGFFQSKWKDCNLKLTPVFKSDQKDVVSSYLGIALLPIVSKVLERQVHTRLYQQVSRLLYCQQHGFRKQKSCITQLLQIVHSMAKSLDDGIHTDVIYLDMAKAFDKVPLEKLLYKLEMAMESNRQEELSIVSLI